MTYTNCTKCDISLVRNKVCIATGSRSADIMIVGENPGYHEDKQGVPFVGLSGKLLDTYFNICGFSREYIYITNAVKCKTPKNYVPTDLEIDNCRPYLIDEINTVKPKILIALGNTAFKSIFMYNSNTYYKFSNVVGKWFTWNNIKCMAMYHPSFILRNENLKGEYLTMFKKIVTEYRTINPYHKINY